MQLKLKTATSIEAVIEDAGALVIVKASGLFALKDCVTLVGSVRAAVQQSPARAVLVDVRGAAFTMSSSDYVELMRAVLWASIRHPVAFVAGPWVMRVASAHESVLKRRGYSHRFFDSPAGAMRWLGRLRAEPREPDLLG